MSGAGNGLVVLACKAARRACVHTRAGQDFSSLAEPLLCSQRLMALSLARLFDVFLLASKPVDKCVLNGADGAEGHRRLLNAQQPDPAAHVR